MQTGVTKPQRADLVRQCIDSIQHYVSLNEMAPGEKLPSLQEWSDTLGVSVVVVREAFRALQALGVVDIQHGRGIYVMEPGGYRLPHFSELPPVTRSFQPGGGHRRPRDAGVSGIGDMHWPGRQCRHLRAGQRTWRSAPAPFSGGSGLGRAQALPSGDASGIWRSAAREHWAAVTEHLLGAGQQRRSRSAGRCLKQSRYEPACHEDYVDAIKRRDMSDKHENSSTGTFSGFCSRYGICTRSRIPTEKPGRLLGGPSPKTKGFSSRATKKKEVLRTKSAET